MTEWYTGISGISRESQLPASRWKCKEAPSEAKCEIGNGYRASCGEIFLAVSEIPYRLGLRATNCATVKRRVSRTKGRERIP